MHDEQQSHCQMDRWGAGVFVWLVLHAIPLPCPVRYLKSIQPDEYWQSLGFFDAPWDWAQPLLAILFVPSEVRDVGWVLLFYEPLLLIITVWVIYRWPHWFIGRE